MDTRRKFFSNNYLNYVYKPSVWASRSRRDFAESDRGAAGSFRPPRFFPPFQMAALPGNCYVPPPKVFEACLGQA
jgi:hypothetical protein